MKIRWISCKDELPSEDGRYLVCVGSGKDIAVRIDYYSTEKYVNEIWVIPKGFSVFDFHEPYFYPSPNVTYWADLPEPPEEEIDGDS